MCGAAFPGPISGEIGTAHPVRVDAYAPSGHWVVLRQARRDTDGDGHIVVHADGQALSGDAMEAYFVDEPGPGIPIDGLAGASSDGRWVVLAREGTLVLRDTFARREEPLGPVGDLVPVVAFDGKSRRMAYARRSRTATELRIRALDDGTEHRVSAPPGAILDFRLDATGDVAVAVIDDEQGRRAVHVARAPG